MREFLERFVDFNNPRDPFDRCPLRRLLNFDHLQDSRTAHSQPDIEYKNFTATSTDRNVPFSRGPTRSSDQSRRLEDETTSRTFPRSIEPDRFFGLPRHYGPMDDAPPDFSDF